MFQSGRSRSNNSYWTPCGENMVLLPDRDEITFWLDSETARLEPNLTQLSYWFHPKETSGFGVSLTCLYGVSGEFHVFDNGSMTFCWTRGDWPDDEIGDSDQATAWSDVTARFAEFLATAARMEEEERARKLGR